MESTPPISSPSPVQELIENTEEIVLSGGSKPASPCNVPKDVGEADDVTVDQTTSLEDNSILNEDHICQICNSKFKQPRVLTCLHEFCTPCLEKQLEETLEELELEVDSPSRKPDVILCPLCEQETAIQKEKGVEGLPLDYVLIKLIDGGDSEEMQIICTSCKAREKAVARCSDCANFLCPNCVTAHQYMRCFENHKVVSFDELQNDDSLDLQKLMFCQNHITETLKYFCNTCQVPICQECMVVDHKQQDNHEVACISDIEKEERSVTEKLVKECQVKAALCREASDSLDQKQQDLGMHRDNARDLLQETFHSYKAILDQIKDDMLKELSDMHANERTRLWDVEHGVVKTLEKIDAGCKFAERTLGNGNSIETLLMQKVIRRQLQGLIDNTPKLDRNMEIRFETNKELFELNVRKFFGTLRCKDENSVSTELEQQLLDQITEPGEDEEPNMSQSSQISSLQGYSPNILNPTVDGVNLAQPAADIIASLTSGLPPLSINLSNIGHIPGVDTMATSSGLPAAAPLPMRATSIGPTGSVSEISKERSSSSRNSYSPAMSDSGISVGDAASTGSNPMNLQQPVNLAALSKIGDVSITPQGQILMNGQVLHSLNLSNVTGLPEAMMAARNQQRQSQADAALASILNSGRSPTPDMTTLLGSTGTASPLTIAGLPSAASGSSGSSGGLFSPGLPSSIGGATTPTSMLPNGTLGPGLHTPPAPGQTSALGQSVYPNRTAKMSMQIRNKFGQLGPGKCQFNSPHGFCLGVDEEIVVADTNNHRIQVFEKNGEFKYQFGIPGREEGQLWYPRKVAVIRHSGKYVVCDRGNERSRMQIFNKNGHFIRKIAIRYIDIVAGLAITNAGHIVAVDSVSPTVFCIAETGDLVKWFDCSDYMREPSDIAVNGKEYYVCDFKGHCVVVFSEEGQFLRRIGCENITNFPNGIDISDAGDVLVGDSHGNRFHVGVFQRDGSLIGEFECPYVKVSRCCGLKITSEGYIVTLAKNNHHVLVLNTLYIA